MKDKIPNALIWTSIITLILLQLIILFCPAIRKPPVVISEDIQKFLIGVWTTLLYALAGVKTYNLYLDYKIDSDQKQRAAQEKREETQRKEQDEARKARRTASESCLKELKELLAKETDKESRSKIMERMLQHL